MDNFKLRITDNNTGTDVSVIFESTPMDLPEIDLRPLGFFRAESAIPTGSLVKIGADGQELPDYATDHVAVLVRNRNIWFTARKISPKRLDWDDAEAACKALTLCGHKDWNLPELQDLEAIRDLTKYNPAADTNFFPGMDPNWHWSRTPYAGNPSSDAWVVGFGHGYSGYGSRDDECNVLAVRSAGQSL